MKIEKLKNTAAPIVLIYGEPGRGKTLLASKFPKTVWMPFERGLPVGVSADAIAELNTFGNVIETLQELCKDPAGFRTVIVDTVDALEPIVHDHVCGKHNLKNIEAAPYGKGYIFADEVWRSFIRGITTLRDRHNVTVILIAHSEIVRFDDPRAPTYSQYQPKLHKRARHLILDACDAVFFLSEELKVFVDDQGFKERVRATSTNQRFLHSEGCAAYVAKNRFGIPPKLPIPLDFNIGELSKYWRQAND